MIQDLFISYWVSVLTILIMVVLITLGWWILSKKKTATRSNDDSKNEEAENEKCPLKNHDMKKCPKCGEVKVRVYGDGSVECENCGFSLKGGELF